jgi:hypothetical protein
MSSNMSERDLQQHVTVLGWLYVFANSLFLLIGLFIFIFLPGIGAITGDREAMVILTFVGMSVGVFLSVLALPGLFAAYGLLRRKNWGRILALVIAILGLVNVPIGTLVGVYALWVLLQPAATEFFNGEKPLPPHAAAPV